MRRPRREIVQQIEQIHSAWIEREIGGEIAGMRALCAEEIELCPPDGPPLHGSDAVFSYLAGGAAKILSIEISDRLLHGSRDQMFLTANYTTSFCLPGDPVSRQATGSHVWELRKQSGQWLIVRIRWFS